MVKISAAAFTVSMLSIVPLLLETVKAHIKPSAETGLTVIGLQEEFLLVVAL